MQEREKGISSTQGDNDEDAFPVPLPPVRLKKVVEQQDNGLIPHPFPISNLLGTSEDPFIVHKNAVCAPSSQQSSHTAPKKHTNSSGSDSFQPCITKSPRKSPQQTSPRSGLATRPGPSSPIRPIHRFDDVIDISSDSDVPSRPTKPSVKAPLLLAREKAKKVASSSSVKSKPPVFELTSKGNSKRVVTEDDVIDLT
jgi:Holliday junction resolvase YEN1